MGGFYIQLHRYLIVLLCGGLLVPVYSCVQHIPSERGNILYVGGSGPGNYSSIQEAIDQAQPGYTIYVYQGNYEESLTIPTAIILQGEASEATNIIGEKNTNVINIEADNVTITGFTISSPDIYNWPKGIYILANNTEIAYNIITNVGYGIQKKSTYKGMNYRIHHNILIDNFWGMGLYQLTHTHIFNNTLKNIHYGLILSYAQQNMIYNNHFFDTGIEVHSSYDNLMYNNTLNDKPLLYLENEHNKIINDIGQVILVNCSKIRIQNCQFTGHYHYAIQLRGSNRCVIFNNTFTNNWCDLENSKSTLITQNTFNTGIIETYCTLNTIITHNSFINCNFSIFLYFGTYLTTISHNNFIKNQQDIVCLFSYITVLRRNYWGEPCLLPKIIHVNFYHYQPNRILIDWRPALRPYRIGVIA